MVTVGVLVRAAVDATSDVRRRLAALEGVETLELEEPGTLGLVLSGESLDELHAKLTTEIQTTEGVLVAWPVHTQLEGDPADLERDETKDEPQVKEPI